MNASIQQKLANKLGELLDEKLDKHIELMRQKKLKQKAREAKNKKEAAAEALRKESEKDVAQGADGRSVKLTAESVYTYTGEGKVLPIIAPNTNKLPPLNAAKTEVKGFSTVARPK